MDLCYITVGIMLEKIIMQNLDIFSLSRLSQKDDSWNFVLPIHCSLVMIFQFLLILFNHFFLAYLACWGVWCLIDRSVFICLNNVLPHLLRNHKLNFQNLPSFASLGKFCCVHSPQIDLCIQNPHGV